MILFLLAFPIVSTFQSSRTIEVIAAGVHIGDVRVGGMTVDRARDILTARTAALAGQSAEIKLNDTVWAPSLADLGVGYDIEASIDAAFTPPAAGGVKAEPEIGRFVPLAVTFNPMVFEAYLDGLLDELGDRAVNAGVVIEGVEAQVTPARAGMMVDAEALRATLLQQVSGLQPVILHADAEMHDPPITNEMAEDARLKVEHALAEPWVLTLTDQSWTLEPAEIAPALRVVPMNDASLQLSWDASALDGVMNALAAEVDTEAADSWVQDLDTKSWLVPAIDARKLDRAGLVVAMQDALTRGEHRVEVPVIVLGEPSVSTTAAMADLGITNVVGEGDSIYAGSPYGRTNNVEVAAHMVDGTLVAPGEVFSFNAAVGSLFNGLYMDAGSYIDGPAGESLAGGVCQVSTTVFRAALDAGFPIVEWWPHSYRSPFYELGGWSPGYDAAIVQVSNDPSESTDMRFLNTTDSWLMVSAKAVDGELKVEIHGAETGYTVEFAEPVVETIEWATGEVSVVVDEQLPPGTVDEQPAMDGLRVTVVRYVYDADGELVSEDTFVTSYGSYGGIRRLSPDMAETAQGQ